MTEDGISNEQTDAKYERNVRNRCTAKNDEELVKGDNKNEEFKSQIRWPDFTAQVFIHGGCVYGLYLALFHARFYTSLFGNLLIFH